MERKKIMKPRIDQNPYTLLNETPSNPLNIRPGEFQRFEDKFLIYSTDKNKLLETLYSNMSLSYLRKDTQFTLIDSLYFDSPQLDFFQHHFLPMETRFKMRVRWYAPNGIWNRDEIHLELKSKKQGKSKKARFTISPLILKKISSGEIISISSELRSINPNLEEKTLQKRVTKINDLITEYSLRPIISIKYHRLAFEQQNFRVTVDQQLSGQECLYLTPRFIHDLQEKKEVWEKANLFWEKFGPNQHLIMELKHQGNIPEWMVDLIRELNADKTSFSKYCWMIIAKMMELPSQFN